MSSRMLIAVVLAMFVLFVVVRCDVRHAASGAAPVRPPLPGTSPITPHCGSSRPRPPTS